MLKALRDVFLITAITFLFMFGLVNLPLNFEMLNPIQNVFKDFDMTDVVSSQIREDPAAEDDIVIVNFGNLNRGELAEMINILNKHEPKVIGIDAFYRRLTDPTMDSSLAASLNKVKNLVLITKLNKYNEKKKSYDTLETSNPIFNAKAINGYANLTTSGASNISEFLTSRSFIPKAKYKNEKQYAFAVKVAELYNPNATKKFLARNKSTEFINYKGNIGEIAYDTNGEIDQSKSKATIFPALDVMQVMNEEFEPSLIKGKIVLIGYMGVSLAQKSFDDKFYTPLNENYVGKSTPDMFGLVVHANIVSMILDEQYIDELNPILNYTLIVLVALLSISLFAYFYRKLGYWFDAVTIVFQLAISLLLLSVVIFSFHWYRLKVEINAGLLIVILSGIVVELYYGLFTKLVEGFKKKEKLKEKPNI